MRNERGFFNRRPNSPQFSDKPAIPATTLHSATVEVERKTFVFQLQDNPRGRLLRITEEVKDHRNSIVIPATGLADFDRILKEMVEAAGAHTP